MVRDGADVLLADLEDGERDAEQGFRALVEERVPHAQHRLDRQVADEEGHEPGGCGERDGREARGGCHGVGWA